MSEFIGLIANFPKFAKHKYKTILKNTQKHISALCILTAVLFSFKSYSVRADGDRALGLRTVCIDPGHGGKDPGCVSADKKTYESRVNLDIAKRVSALIKEKCPDVKVIMTRSNDTFVTLAGRADIANRGNADLFLSIHVNSAPSAPSANGYSVHILGQSSKKDRDLFAYNMDVCRRENSVIKLEDDYSTTYQSFDPSDPESFIFFNLMQNSHLEHSLLFAQDLEKAMNGGVIRSSRGVWQDPFLVLWKTSMPSALVEVGFMSNSKDLAVLRTESGRAAIAREICNAFLVFKKRYDESIGDSGSGFDSVAVQENSAESVDDSRLQVRYGVQVLATGKTMKDDDPYFKGYKPLMVRKGSLNKYIIGVSGSREEAAASFSRIRKSFSGSFLVEISDGDVKPLK